MNNLIAKILKDIQVDLKDEFNQNFERQAFFADKWQRRKSPIRNEGRAILTDTGKLRGSIKSRIEGNSIVFYSDVPHAAIHNEGGEIVVTDKMKRYFWAKYYETTGSFGRKKDGSLRNDKRNAQLSTEAEFWRFMALKKVGTTIVIPRRRFLGKSPEVEEAVRAIVEKHLRDYVGKTIDFKISEK